MKTGAVDVAILLLLLFELASGPGGFLIGSRAAGGCSGFTAPAASPWSCSWYGKWA